MRSELHIEIFSRVGMEGAQAGIQFLRHYCNALPELVPQKYGNTEPLRTTFSAESVEQIVAGAWEYPFLWQRLRPRTRGIALMYAPGRHSTVGIHYKEGSGVVINRVRQYVTAEAIRLSADWAYMYAYHDQDGKRPDYHEVAHPLRIGCGAPQLKECFLDLPWFNVFGPVYVEFFGRDRLLSSPCFQAVELTDSHVYVQLTETIPEDESAYQQFHVTKNAVKHHLGSDAFYDRQKGPSGPYRVPNF